MKSKIQIHYSIALVIVLSFFSKLIKAQLEVGFYDKTCPSAETIVKEQVHKAFATDNGIAPGLLRIHLHDCFVRGCDGSILIDSTANNTAEKDSRVNNPSLKGFEVIDAAKALIEAQCKGTVSCADILAFAARDSIVLTQGPFYAVPSGRRDGRVSLASEPATNIASPVLNVTEVSRKFANKGLTQDDMVTLAGAHTIGRSLCKEITLVEDRIYDFNGTNSPDPMLNTSYVPQLRRACPKGRYGADTVVSLEPETPMVMDVKYYSNLLANKGLFTSDSTLLNNPATAAAVTQYAGNQTLWFSKFSAAMVKLGNVGVRTGKDGEIRTNCRVIN